MSWSKNWFRHSSTIIPGSAWDLTIICSLIPCKLENPSAPLPHGNDHKSHWEQCKTHQYCPHKDPVCTQQRGPYLQKYHAHASNTYQLSTVNLRKLRHSRCKFATHSHGDWNLATQIIPQCSPQKDHKTHREQHKGSYSPPLLSRTKIQPVPNKGRVIHTKVPHSYKQHALAKHSNLRNTLPPTMQIRNSQS